MKTILKVTSSTVLLLALLLACTVGFALFFFGAWLHTYQVFTQRTLVAEVSLSPLLADNHGEYINVTYRPYVQESALVGLLAPADDSISWGQGEPLTFKVYGDSVHIGGPIAKFHDNLILLNFQTIYKVGKLYGRYNIDNEKELNREVISSFDLNGGIDATWQDANNKISSWPYNMFFDTTQLSIPGVFASGEKAQLFDLYITNNGFLWDLR
jgi:hypothetical protein